jgi:NADH-quinone oxidoreductase subunit N
MNTNLFSALPEIFMAGMIIIMLLIDAFVSQSKKSINTVLTLVTLIGAFIVQLGVYVPAQVQTAFHDMFILDALTQGVSLLVYIMAGVIVIYCKHYIVDKKLLKGEFYAIFLFAVLGMLLMIAANNMLILYLGLELLSLALYGLVALNRDSVKATESAMKFFILSALSSGILLYGISFIYGATGGNLQLDGVFQAAYTGPGQNTNILVFGLVFIVAGLVFKLGLVPFHMWVPDVYEGASLPVTMIIGTVTKLAAVIFIIRFLIGGLLILSPQWSVMLSFLAFLSLFLGNIAAIMQTNIKRMLGYSAIANMGFVAFALMTVTVEGISAMLFYIVVYVLASLAGFGVLTLLSRDHYECEEIKDLAGLNRSHPIYAFILLLVMFSLAGIPPLVGFYAKFKVLEALMAVGYVRSVIFAVIMSIIGAYYYLRIVKVMYFEEANAELRIADASVFSRFVLVVNGLALLVFGVLPNSLMVYCLKLVTG